MFGKTEGPNLTNPAKFSYKANPQNYNFEVSHDSPYKIETREQEHNGFKFIIPEDAVLFDPDNSFGWGESLQTAKSTLNNAV